MLNVITISGNLGADPEIRYDSDGNTIATLNLAFSCGKDKTGWIQVTAFRKLGDVVQQYLHKGAKIAVSGRLVQDSWETDSGEKRSKLQIIAQSIEFIKVNKQPKEGESQNDDDLPF
ncbi:single-stranded DNA-binding protein [candidate division KSB1 bacterium]